MLYLSHVSMKMKDGGIHEAIGFPGEIAWAIANGDTPPAIKDNEALRGLQIPRTGSVSHAGMLVTKTLLIGRAVPQG
jgi:hypothetical protein